MTPCTRTKLGTDTGTPTRARPPRLRGRPAAAGPSRSSRSAVRPSNRTSPRSRNTDRSARLMARLTLCSTRTTVVPSAFTSRTMSIRRSTAIGASPSASSSMSSSRGRVIITRASASICCSPPDSAPAGCCSRAASSGNRPSASSTAARARGPRAAQRVGAEVQVVPDGESRERHLAADQQGDPLADDLLRFEEGGGRPRRPGPRPGGGARGRPRCAAGSTCPHRWCRAAPSPPLRPRRR